ncbi:MAG: single-stranded DNA-binding protein [Lachnospiraceae bacterium]|nr:single-stranded DNA-binding protein [Lachnospiraceae bacterium]
MTDKVIENNQVTVMGEVISRFTYSHEVFGEGFYMIDVRVPRLSDSYDTIPVMISERLLDVTENYTGMLICVNGQFRSYNRHEERKNRLVLSVFAREVEFVGRLEESSKTNQIYLDGYICKEPIYRKTPLGREIADLLLAVNRPYGKSDYIPCICWGRNARFADHFRVGERCAIWGRIQSRDYMKKIDEEHVEKRVAFEVSVSKLELIGTLPGREDSLMHEDEDSLISCQPDKTVL